MKLTWLYPRRVARDFPKINGKAARLAGLGAGRVGVAELLEQVSAAQGGFPNRAGLDIYMNPGQNHHYYLHYHLLCKKCRHLTY